MKKNLFSIILGLSAVLVMNTANAQSKLIHYWHFNNYTMADSSTPTHTIAPVPADYSTLSNARILYAKIPAASPAYFTRIDSIYAVAADYDTVNARMGQPDGLALRVRNPSDSMKLLFYIPTTNYKNIKITYGSQSSSVTKGQLHQVFDYSTDSGSTWVTTGLSMPSDSAWLVYHRTTVTFGAVTAVNNNPKLVFRITFNGNDTGSKGNNRFDNVTVEGDTTSTVGIGTIGAADNNYTLYPNPVGATLNIASETEGAKSVSIVNLDGKEVMTANVPGKQWRINVANLPAGVYFVKISEANASKITTMRFIKD